MRNEWLIQKRKQLLRKNFCEESCAEENRKGKGCKKEGGCKEDCAC